MKSQVKNSVTNKLKVITATTAILVLAVFGVASFWSISVEGQTSKTPNSENFVQQIKNYPKQPLLIKQSNNAPLKIVESKVTEISGAEYTKLTGKATELKSVISFPETTLLNVSNKVINQVFFLTKDQSTNNVKSLFIRDISLKPGASFTIKSGANVKTETVTYVDTDGATKKEVREAVLSEDYWLPTSDKNQLQIKVSVTFEGETQWIGENEGQE